MSGVNVGIEVSGIDRVAERLSRLSSLNHALMLEAMGATVESQTRRRIISEKTSPSGAPWRPNLAGTSILVRRGGLRDSIHYKASGTEVRIGSGLVYAAIHQFGGTIVPRNARKLVFRGANGRVVAVDQVTIPARPYLGLSAENRVELERVLLTAIRQLLN